jgi:hypothetical protein
MLRKVEVEKKEIRKESKTVNLLRLKVYAQEGGDRGSDEVVAQVVLKVYCSNSVPVFCWGSTGYIGAGDMKKGDRTWTEQVTGQDG